MSYSGPILKLRQKLCHKASPPSNVKFLFHVSLGITNCQLVAGLSGSVSLISVLNSGGLGGRGKFGLCGLALAETTSIHHCFHHWRLLRPCCRAESSAVSRQMQGWCAVILGASTARGEAFSSGLDPCVSSLVVPSAFVLAFLSLLNAYAKTPIDLSAGMPITMPMIISSVVERTMSPWPFVHLSGGLDPILCRLFRWQPWIEQYCHCSRCFAPFDSTSDHCTRSCRTKH